MIMNILNIFKKSLQPKTIFDYSQSIPKEYVVVAFRSFASKNNVAPTLNITDQEVIDIYQRVGLAFIEASKKRNKFLPDRQLNMIIKYFFEIYEQDKNTFEDKLKIEVDSYIKVGLKSEYQKELDLSEFYHFL